MASEHDFRVFVSYSSEHSFDVEAFNERLEKLLREHLFQRPSQRRIRFFSNRAIEFRSLARSSELWRTSELHRELEAAHCCIFVVSDGFFRERSLSSALLEELSVKWDDERVNTRCFLALDAIEASQVERILPRFRHIRYTPSPDPESLAMQISERFLSLRADQEAFIPLSGLESTGSSASLALESRKERATSLIESVIALSQSRRFVQSLSLSMLVVPLAAFLLGLANHQIILAPQLLVTAVAGVFGLRTSTRWEQ